ncbi:alpha/beta hydrolase [Anopheles sinensis]|uniref:Alpha/beta hydrolase n=1 Tax=Anopheles sinensis TaxID=74873 RepID=A0A084W4N3_ANOSI|nr:alpha/beta hydrolase [Anopheles sinensis]
MKASRRRREDEASSFASLRQPQFSVGTVSCVVVVVAAYWFGGSRCWQANLVAHKDPLAGRYVKVANRFTPETEGR